MKMTRCVAYALLPIAAGLMGPAMPGISAAQQVPDAEQNSRRPDWVLLAVAGVAFVIGRGVIPRVYKRSRKTPR